MKFLQFLARCAGRTIVALSCLSVGLILGGILTYVVARELGASWPGELRRDLALWIQGSRARRAASTASLQAVERPEGQRSGSPRSATLDFGPRASGASRLSSAERATWSGHASVVTSALGRDFEEDLLRVFDRLLARDDPQHLPLTSLAELRARRHEVLALLEGQLAKHARPLLRRAAIPAQGSEIGARPSDRRLAELIDRCLRSSESEPTAFALYDSLEAARRTAVLAELAEYRPESAARLARGLRTNNSSPRTPSTEPASAQAES